MRISGVLAVAFAGAALMATGCGRDLESAGVATIDAASPRPLSSAERGLIRAGAAFTKDGSPGAVVVRFLTDLRDGAGPALFAEYDRRIPARIGDGDVLGAIQVMSEIAKDTVPVVVRRRTTRAGELVTARLLRTGEDSTYSFVLRRPDGRWTIVYDSLLAQALPSFVQSRRASDPAKPTSSANRAAARAVAQLRLVGRPPQVGRGRARATAAAPRRSASGQSQGTAGRGAAQGTTGSTTTTP
jgi:hypothetical protein